MKLCGGCQTKLPDEWHGKCAQCKAERQAPPVEGRQHIAFGTGTYDEHIDKLNKGTRWQRTRKTVISHSPFCKRCGIRLSEIVDHIVPAWVAIKQACESGLWPFDRWAGYYLISNLQALCRPCHGAKTKEDKEHIGAWPSVVEAAQAAPKKRWSF